MLLRLLRLLRLLGSGNPVASLITNQDKLPIMANIAAKRRTQEDPPPDDLLLRLIGLEIQRMGRPTDIMAQPRQGVHPSHRQIQVQVVI